MRVKQVIEEIIYIFSCILSFGVLWIFRIVISKGVAEGKKWNE